MINKKRWNTVQKFENEYQRRFLRELTQKESMRIFGDLYQFGQRMVDKDYYKRLDHVKIETLIKVHRRFMKVK